MRIVGGKFRGKSLTSPADRRVRPTAEHVRTTMLDLLKPDMQKARILDLFAGTGAMGLEAISRGARSADFVEFGLGSLHSLKANVATLGLKEKTRIFKRDAVLFLESCKPLSYEIVFADPPYEFKIHERLIGSWLAGRVSPILVVEHSSKQELPHPATRQLFGDTAVSIYRA